MNPNQEGFKEPFIDIDKCVECGLCEKSCPIINGKDYKNPEASSALAFWDYKYRTVSSSGGAFSAVAEWVLSKHGSVYGASWDDNLMVVHKRVDSSEDLYKLRGSKYVQSDVKDTFRSVRYDLKNGKYVLFTGTPCQIAGLKAFLMRDYEKLITADIVCHGVPSQPIFSSYIKKLEQEKLRNGKSESFVFRESNRWGYAPSVRFSKNEKWINLAGVENAYMLAFDKALIFRESCYDCKFNGLSRIGDITIADFWGIGKMGLKFRHDVSKGVSLVFANSEKGKKIISELTNCFCETRPLSEALPLNQNITQSSTLSPNRKQAIEAFLDPNYSLNEICNDFKLIDPNLKSAIKIFLVKTQLIWPLKSLINKLRAL